MVEEESKSVVEDAPKSSIRELKDTLGELEDHKKSVLERKREIGSSIAGLISSLRLLKQERDSLTSEVKSLKDQRTQLNSAVKKALDAIAEHKKNNPPPSRDNRVNPSAIKKRIDELEYKIETEAPSYDVEKKIMKQINSLKLEYNESKKVDVHWSEHEKLKEQLRSAKKEADSIHKVLQQKARLSQEKHNTLLETAKKIDDLRVMEEQLRAEYGSHAEKTHDVREVLGAELERHTKDKRERARKKKESDDRKRHEHDRKIEEKKQSVEEKIARGEKLTTEDLIALQG